jgi:hypothetical protein
MIERVVYSVSMCKPPSGGDVGDVIQTEIITKERSTLPWYNTRILRVLIPQPVPARDRFNPQLRLSCETSIQLGYVSLDASSTVQDENLIIVAYPQP